ncbi:Serine protease family s33 [Globisporangium polare]
MSHARTVSSVDSIRESVPSSWRAVHMPSWLSHQDGAFRNARGETLSYVTLFPPVKTPLRGIVLFLHGLGEHSRRYFHLYEQLCEHGFGTIAYDLHSHGESDSGRHKLRVHAEKFQHFVDDTNEFIAYAKQNLLPELLPEPYNLSPSALPLIFAGTSFGTLVGLHTLLSEKHAFDGVVLVSPAISVEWTPILRIQSIFARPMSVILPKVRAVSATRAEFICRDPAFLEDFANDPLTRLENMTLRMGAQSLRACNALQKEKRFTERSSAFCSLPILFMMGSADKVTSLSLAVQFFEKLENEDKQFKVFDGMYHALFDDPEKDEVFDFMLQWLETRFPELKEDVAANPEIITRADEVTGVRIP